MVVVTVPIIISKETRNAWYAKYKDAKFADDEIGNFSSFLSEALDKYGVDMYYKEVVEKL